MASKTKFKPDAHPELNPMEREEQPQRGRVVATMF